MKLRSYMRSNCYPKRASTPTRCRAILRAPDGYALFLEMLDECSKRDKVELVFWEQVQVLTFPPQFLLPSLSYARQPARLRGSPPQHILQLVSIRHAIWR